MMERIALTPRPDWQSKVEALGLHYHTVDGAPYWDESAAYRFTPDQIDTLETASQQLYELTLQAAQHVIDRRLFGRLQIPAAYEELIVRSWEADEHSLYGRFDLVYDGRTAPKLLEFNADTPTALLEASVVQWFWLQEVMPQADQFNSIHEQLIASWKDWAGRHPGLLHFAAVLESAEDRGNLDYLRDTAIQAGIETASLDIGEIGWDEGQRCFVDLQERPIRALFKLYPWEWLLRESFGRHLEAANCRYLEPPWKMLLSNKGLLPLLWELFPDHPNLLPAYFESGRIAGDHVRKPLYSREGANITVVRNGMATTTAGSYGEEGHIWQAYAPLPEFAGHYPVIGSWIVHHQACGIGIREDRSPVTSDASRFVPHFFTE